ncbi:unnamed protein product, partial [marine sediment metagenome]
EPILDRVPSRAIDEKDSISLMFFFIFEIFVHNEIEIDDLWAYTAHKRKTE